MQTVDVSIIILTYNSALFVEDAILSVLGQEFSGRCELIIADDGSIDETTTVTDRIINGYSGPIDVQHIKHPKNLGLHGNNNWIDALKKVRGKYTCQLDSDDVWLNKTCIQSRFDFLETHPDIAVVSDGYVIQYENGDTIESKVADDTVKPSYRQHPHYALLGSCMWKSVDVATFPVDLLPFGYNDDCFHFAKCDEPYAFRSNVSLRYRRTGNGIATSLTTFNSLVKKYEWFSAALKHRDYQSEEYPIDLVKYDWYAVEQCLEQGHSAGVRFFAGKILSDMTQQQSSSYYWYIKYAIVWLAPIFLIVYKRSSQLIKN